MAIPVEHSSVSTMDQQVTHPLDPLTSGEIVLAAGILREQRQLGPRVRFETIVLNEPEKSVAAGFAPGDPIHREAFLVILDNEDASTWEAVVSLNEGKVTSWKHVPGVQPRIMFDEFAECEATVRADPRFQAALRKRGITDPDLVMVDPWSAGYYGYEDEEGRRLALARNFLRSSPHRQRLRPAHRGPQRAGGPEQDGNHAHWTTTASFPFPPTRATTQPSL